MTTRRTVLGAALGAAFVRPLAAQRASLNGALLQFEEAVKWEAVTREWRGIRPGWIQRVRAAASPEEVAGLMVQLETNMGWEAVERRWRSRRDAWVAEAEGPGASNPSVVAALLLELEGVTLWSAVDPSWRNTRPGWVASLRTIAGRTGK